MDLPSHLSKPKLCHLKKRSDFVGYGFNLHSEKGKAGQFVGKVDPQSPAEVSGLEPNDVVIEVNGDNVAEATHQQVVAKIKAHAEHVDLYVCSKETFLYCRENGIHLASVARATPQVPIAQPETEKVQQQQSQMQQPKQQQQQQQQHQQQQQQQQQRVQEAQKQSVGRQNGSSDDPIAGISLEDMRAKLGSNRRTQAMLNSASFTDKYKMFESL